VIPRSTILIENPIAVQKRFFDPNSGVMARIERQVGGVTG